MESKHYIKLKNISSSIDELVKEAFFAGIAAGCNGDFARIGSYYVSRHNHGATSDADLNLGWESEGDCFPFDYMINLNSKCFSPITKELAEKYLLVGSWEGLSNSGYNSDGFNRRAVFGDNSVSFYRTSLGDTEIETVLKNNNIDPEKYKHCYFAANWLAEEADDKNAFAIFIPMQNEFYESYGYRQLCHKHRVLTPLILKTPKSYHLQIHNCFRYSFDK